MGLTGAGPVPETRPYFPRLLFRRVPSSPCFTQAWRVSSDCLSFVVRFKTRNKIVPPSGITPLHTLNFTPIQVNQNFRACFLFLLNLLLPLLLPCQFSRIYEQTGHPSAPENEAGNTITLPNMKASAKACLALLLAANLQRTEAIELDVTKTGLFSKSPRSFSLETYKNQPLYRMRRVLSPTGL